MRNRETPGMGGRGAGGVNPCSKAGGSAPCPFILSFHTEAPEKQMKLNTNSVEEGGVGVAVGGLGGLKIMMEK